MEEVDGAYRDIPTLFIELRNPKIKSCHCNHAGEACRENEETNRRKREGKRLSSLALVKETYAYRFRRRRFAKAPR